MSEKIATIAYASKKKRIASDCVNKAELSDKARETNWVDMSFQSERENGKREREHAARKKTRTRTASV